MRNKLFNAILMKACFLVALFATVQVQAATWGIDPNESKVIFKYSFEGTPYQGEFKNVEATFKIDIMKPGSCDFTVTIPIGDIGVESPEVLDYLHDVELFDVDQFPTATFKANKCRLEAGSAFVSDGVLTIRDQTHPMSFPFDLEIEMYDGQPRFHLTSEVTIQRLKYGVGQGYWANTAAVPNDVVIVVDVYAMQQ